MSFDQAAKLITELHGINDNLHTLNLSLFVVTCLIGALLIYLFNQK